MLLALGPERIGEFDDALIPKIALVNVGRRRAPPRDARPG
jgi:hypothetical protein